MGVLWLGILVVLIVLCLCAFYVMCNNSKMDDDTQKDWVKLIIEVVKVVIVPLSFSIFTEAFNNEHISFWDIVLDNAIVVSYAAITAWASWWPIHIRKKNKNKH